MERVFVTGMGVASPIGFELTEFWENLSSGKSGVKELEGEVFEGLPVRIGARVDSRELQRYVSHKERRRMSRSSQMALAAAAGAMAQAGLNDLNETERSRVAVIVGSSIGGFSASDPVFGEYYTAQKQSSLIIPISMNSAPSANISIRHRFGGPHWTADAACASGAHSIGALYNMVRYGQVDIGLTGGADSPFSRAVMQAWYNLRVISHRNDEPSGACRPFSADRDGMVLGEGAGILVLESESSARRRGARAFAEIVGYGASSDGHHITQPSEDGPGLAMTRALADAGLGSGDIDYINAHATGTQWNDRIETAAIKRVLGSHAYEIPVVGTKAVLGHSIGASGALELISTILSIQEQAVPPTINYRVPDPECDLDYVTDGARRVEIRRAMSNSFAFGGSNAAIIVSHSTNPSIRI